MNVTNISRNRLMNIGKILYAIGVEGKEHCYENSNCETFIVILQISNQMYLYWRYNLSITLSIPTFLLKRWIDQLRLLACNENNNFGNTNFARNSLTLYELSNRIENELMQNALIQENQSNEDKKNHDLKSEGTKLKRKIVLLIYLSLCSTLCFILLLFAISPLWITTLFLGTIGLLSPILKAMDWIRENS